MTTQQIVETYHDKALNIEGFQAMHHNEFKDSIQELLQERGAVRTGYAVEVGNYGMGVNTSIRIMDTTLHFEAYTLKPLAKPFPLTANEAEAKVDAYNIEEYGSKPPTRITEEEWMDALEVLPPRRWTGVHDGDSVFYISEALTGDIHAMYAKLTDGRCYTANRCIKTVSNSAFASECSRIEEEEEQANA